MTQLESQPPHNEPVIIFCFEANCVLITMFNRVERFRGVFKKFLKCNRQELPKVVPHHNEETPKFFGNR